tara:strand:+ start:9471 stop:9947 length:477 start_codon:yes stop_codon:yes gene_type:complete
MNKIKTGIIVPAILALSLTACQNVGLKQGMGTILGAAGGGLLGSQFGKGRGQLAAVAAGTLIGALVGSSIGQSLDQTDKMMMERATQRTLENSHDYDGQMWHNSGTGVRGTVRPTRTWQASNGQYCREYQQTVYVGGKNQSAYGTACRRPDGTWEVMN